MNHNPFTELFFKLNVLQFGLFAGMVFLTGYFFGKRVIARLQKKIIMLESERLQSDADILSLEMQLVSQKKNEPVSMHK